MTSVAHEGRITVRSGDAHLSVKVTGRVDGPVVLLSNSLGAGLDMWAPQRAVLEPHFRVIGYDTRGHGQSSTPPGPYRFADLTADMLAILDNFHVVQADIVGLSLGGMTALGMGLNHAGRVRRIVCACARADAPPPFVAGWDDRIAAIDAGGMAAIWPGTLDRWLTPDFAQTHPDVVAALARDFTAMDVAGYTGCARALQSLDYRRDLPGMTVPVLYIAGADDMGAPPAAMQDMAQATPGASYVEIPDCAHIANLNATAAFDRALRQFLEF
ncbi:3-oxoadipate enol-lactonase [Loktanella fryxellensis]|uniref:3-oxoadipate enol-lactonase n=1 Tax=Loktanella fryxellensis TaxID=245187 RepID=A0A1H8C3L5_9RHOB|nr:alpha/beta fold hydrolase [Loktanella fryxellensis]SEM89562.1 3-oxoadipate enol-lactonase [Loktanella fryxellensis]